MAIRVLAVGDVCGAPGLESLRRYLGSLKQTYGVDFTVVNGENANVVGITPDQAEDIFDAGADVITLGNHTWAYRDMRDYIEDNERVLRPLNYTAICPGRGSGIYRVGGTEICVINLLGRYGMDSNADNPFSAVEFELAEIDAPVVLVDIHAEATSERVAMGWFLDGRVSAVWGTHTHVQTSDGGVLSGGTGYISDLGMTGAVNSVLGIQPEQSIQRFLGAPPERYKTAAGPLKLECAIFEIDERSGRCLDVITLRIT